jgi:hypothetical protein
MAPAAVTALAIAAMLARQYVIGLVFEAAAEFFVIERLPE